MGPLGGLILPQSGALDPALTAGGHPSGLLHLRSSLFLLGVLRLT